jgi:hypothetical protein
MYYRLSEGIFKNLGTSNLIYILGSMRKFFWNYLIGPEPNYCNENQYYDPVKDACYYCDDICNHCYGPSDSSCFDCKDPYTFIDTSSKACRQICPPQTSAVVKYENIKFCQSNKD